jgi:hypothetical protein
MVKGIWKETVVAKFELLFHHISGGFEENCEDNRFLGHDSKPGRPEYKFILLSLYKSQLAKHYVMKT